MALDLLSMLRQIVELGFTVKAALEQAGHNAEDCRWIGGLVPRLRDVAAHLQEAAAPEAAGGGGSTAMRRDAAEGLGDALRRASELVARCQRRRNLVLRAAEAGDVAESLRRVCLDVLLNLGAAVLAEGVHTAAMVAEIKEAVGQLRADFASNAMFTRILQIVAAHPDVRLREEVAALVKDYQNSTEYASSQNENKRDTKKTDVGRPELKIQKNNGLGDSKVALHASLSDGLADSASVESVTGQYGSSTIINKIISRSIKNMTLVTSIDAHPTKTWIVMGHEEGNFFIWDYQKQEIVMELQVNEVPGKFARRIHGISQIFKETAVPHSVCSVKFIAQEKWLAVGDGEGYIYVYDYTDTHKLYEVTRFRAYRHKSVNSLAVHPTETYLLSSSAFGRKIKLWDWSKDWEKIKEFDVKPSTYEDGVCSVKFNPRDTNSFACVLYDKTVKVGNINSSNLKTLKGAFNADYFFTSRHQHLMVTLSSKSPDSEIRDLDTGKIVHTLGVSGLKTSRVACHPTLPILATTLDDGTVCLWDASAYKLEEVVHITDNKCRDLVFVTDINGLTRLIVTFETTIAIMEVNLPIANTSKQTGSGDYG